MNSTTDDQEKALESKDIKHEDDNKGGVFGSSNLKVIKVLEKSTFTVYLAYSKIE